jgi:hypothetical protein
MLLDSLGRETVRHDSVLGTYSPRAGRRPTSVGVFSVCWGFCPLRSAAVRVFRLPSSEVTVWSLDTSCSKNQYYSIYVHR